MRLAKGSMDSDTADKYYGKANICKNKLIELCDNNSDVLRLDKARISLRGVLSVDNVGRLSITPQAIKESEISHTEAYKTIIDRINRINKSTNGGIAYKEVKELKNKLTEGAIIEKLGGGDLTGGSCASVGLAYAGNKNGLDVTDFRGGESRSFFSSRFNLEELAKVFKADTVKRETARSYITSGNKLLKQVEKGKEYYFVCGRHAAIVRRTEEDVLQYLELQSSRNNGWIDFNGNPRYTLSTRFGNRSSEGRDVSTFMIDVDSFKDNEEFKEILGYINTASDKQKKGASGYAK